MHRDLRLRFWVLAALAVLTLVATVLTAISAEWIEELTGWEPDGGNGSLELALVGGFALATVTFALLARRDWRAAPATG